MTPLSPNCIRPQCTYIHNQALRLYCEMWLERVKFKNVRRRVARGKRRMKKKTIQHDELEGRAEWAKVPLLSLPGTDFSTGRFEGCENVRSGFVRALQYFASPASRARNEWKTKQFRPVLERGGGGHNGPPEIFKTFSRFLGHGLSPL